MSCSEQRRSHRVFTEVRAMTDTVRNAFSAFGLAPDEATIDTLRTDLGLALRKFIENSNMGQAKVGEVLGLKQSVISDITRGRIEHLSVERLVRAMVKANIPGFAEWSGNADDARAGIGVPASRAFTTTVVVTDPIGTDYPEHWLGKDAPGFHRAWKVKATVG